MKTTKTTFEKGRKKTGGRVKGQPNNVAIELKQMLHDMVPEEELRRRWMKYLNCKDWHISWKAFELMCHYRFGKPVQPIVGEEFAPPIKIDISAIPQHLVKA